MDMAKVIDTENQDVKKLLYMLPSGFSYVVEAFNKDGDGFCAELRLPISNKEEALRWIAMFEEESLTTFRVERTYPENTDRIVFKKEYRCQHNTRPGSHKVNKPHEKHTGCRAKLAVTVKQQVKRSKDPHLSEYPCKILLRHTHNHVIEAADTVQQCTPTTFVVEPSFEYLFATEHSPSTSPLHFSDNELEDNISELKNKIECFGKNVIAKLEKNPEVFYNAIDKFLKTYDSLKTDLALVSALNNFGSTDPPAQSVEMCEDLQSGKITREQQNTNGKCKRLNDSDIPNEKKRKAPPSLTYTTENVSIAEKQVT